MRLVLKMTVNTHDLVMENAEEEIGDLWQPPFRAASYCLQEDFNLDQAMDWINLSTSIKETYWNMRVKAQLEAKKGMRDYAIVSMSKAIELGEKMENEPFDFAEMKAKLEEWKK